jgi:hypothetical protein
MKILICLFLFQFLVYLSFCQTNKTKPTISDSIAKIIQGLPEYQAVQKNANSMQLASRSLDAKFSAGVLVVIEYKDNGEIANKIANVSITEKFDTVVKVIYTIKYDIKFKKIVSFKKEN